MTEIVDASVAVLLRKDGAVLLGQRPEGKPWAGWWEFPGGKIEAGESPAHAMQRELHEELGIEAATYYPWLTRTFAYPERTVRLHFFTVYSWLGELHGKENQQISWEYPTAVSVSPVLPANEPIFSALQLPPVCAITNAAEMGESTFLSRLDIALENGLRLIQVREKHLDEAALEDFARQVVARAHHYGARVLLNADEPLMQRVGADGIHFSASRLMACTSRPQGMLCGASCHTETELMHAAELELDFVLLSPVKQTQSHPEISTIGWERFSDLISAYPLPVYALGGLSHQDLRDAWEHGGHGVAMQRSVWQ